MKKLIVLIGLTFMSLASMAIDKVCYYKLTMNLKVPVIVNNMQSLGKRVYKTQRLTGTLLIIYKDGYYPVIRIENLVNNSYKINGKKVTYKTYVIDDETKCNYIGNNKTDKFNTPTLKFNIECNPSYNIGDDEPDNTLILTLSGHGSSKLVSDIRRINSIRGYAAGQIGCGCRSYNHISPTRVAGMFGPMLDKVEDIASVHGSWSIKFLQSINYKNYEVELNDD